MPASTVLCEDLGKLACRVDLGRRGIEQRKDVILRENEAAFSGHLFRSNRGIHTSVRPKLIHAMTPCPYLRIAREMFRTACLPEVCIPQEGTHIARSKSTAHPASANQLNSLESYAQ